MAISQVASRSIPRKYDFSTTNKKSHALPSSALTLPWSELDFAGLTLMLGPSDW